MTDNIYTALNRVMKEVGYVQKTKAGQLSYTYAGEAALIAAIRPHLVEQGIVVHPLSVQTINQDDYMTANNKLMNRTTVVMVYRFAHAESDTHIDVAVTGEGSDMGDKSANKALTGAYKYALRQTLLIETGDDPDQFSSEVIQTTTTQQQPTTSTNGKPTSNKIADAWLWTEDKFVNDSINLGFLADGLVMTGKYKAREHVANLLNGKECKHLRDAGLVVDFRRKVSRKGAGEIWNLAIERKEATDG